MLTLPIKRQWYDMILCGQKREEYREDNPYYDFYNAPIDDLKAIAEIVGFNPSALDRARR